MKELQKKVGRDKLNVIGTLFITVLAGALLAAAVTAFGLLFWNLFKAIFNG